MQIQNEWNHLCLIHYGSFLLFIWLINNNKIKLFIIIIWIKYLLNVFFLIIFKIKLVLIRFNENIIWNKIS
jgi:hypothetical protein